MNFIAHRGNNNHKFKDNTVEAIVQSLNEDYISGVEFDIRLTKDNQIIVYHNLLLSDKNGNLNLIKNMQLNEIKKANKNISTLDELLKNIKSTKIIIIEIKEESNDFDIFIIKLFNILKKYKYLNIYICSFNYKIIKKIKAKYPKYQCGLIIGYFINTKNISDDFDFYLYGINYIEYINYNKEIFIYTINNKDKFSVLKNKVNKEFYVISDKSYLFNS